MTQRRGLDDGPPLPHRHTPGAGGPWSYARVLADPEAAWREIVALIASRNAWHRKADKAEQQLKLARRPPRPDHGGRPE